MVFIRKHSTYIKTLQDNSDHNQWIVFGPMMGNVNTEHS
jgi:hypothetical protein